MCGDCDSTGSVVGQIAGAFYGSREGEGEGEGEETKELKEGEGREEGLEKVWVEQVRSWDEREAEMRAILLFVEGCREEEGKELCIK